MNHTKNVLVSLVRACHQCPLPPPPQVVLENGTVRGFYQTTQSGRRVAAFQGIPFAKPPIGRRRFKEPVPADPWIGTLHATSPPCFCLQWTHLGYVIKGSEDCLYLNVYTPRLPSGSGLDVLMDVIVHFHGGAFMFFSGAPYGPKYLLDKDVVLVTVNYRLGPLGFICTGDEVTPGNLGMKDQVMALKWVQNNIAAFSGNSDNVTITGMSAGGASVHYHMLSPLSKGLFHKAISMSGNSLNPWAYGENLTEKTYSMASSLGCCFRQPHLLLKCLRSRPASEIVSYSKKMQSWRYAPFSPWAPSVEPPNPNPFLPEQPVDIILNGKAQEIPWLQSYTSMEGLYPGADFAFEKKYLDELEAGWNMFLPDLLHLRETAPKDKLCEIVQKIKAFYLKGKPANDPSSFEPLIKMMGDRLFVCGIGEAAVLHATKYKSPVYCYKFVHAGEESLASNLSHKKQKLSGAGHGDDLGYVLEYQPVISSQEDLAVSQKMVQLWTTFASKGDRERRWRGGRWELTRARIRRRLLKGVSREEPPTLSPDTAMRYGEGMFPTRVLALAAVLLGAGALAQQGQAPQVVLETGTLRGSYQTTLLGRRVAAFQGVPYAKPPVGKHRFKESVPADPWLGVFNATSPPGYCLQWTHFGYKVIGSEDCLYLNVFTPKIPTGSSSDPLMDVIVFFHGGAFMFSMGSYGPKYLLDRDVVLVTLNYRLGPLGFFSTGDEVIPGNMGVKDQVLALKWIKNNIAAFGGNPNNVMITGLSAGGASVHYHMLSPLSKGLFHKAASLSGNSLNPWAFTENIPEKSKALASYLGCDLNNSHLIVKCLRSRPDKDIVAYSELMQSWRYSPFSPWGPSVEPPNPNSFLPEKPIDIILSGKAQDVPWMSSYTSLEGLYPVADFVFDQKHMDALEAGWETILPDLLHMRDTAPKEKLAGMVKKVTDFYMKGTPANTPAGRDPFIKMAGDRLFDYGVAEASVIHAKIYKSPIYSYKFSYEGEDSVAHAMCHCKEKLNGACHGDELGYILENSPKITTKEDLALVPKLVNLWATFASKGIAEWDGMKWPTLQETSPEFTYLEIGQNGKAQLVTEQNTGNMKFWHSLGLPENIPSPGIKRDEL